MIPVCVLRSGGIYTPDHVHRLARQLRGNMPSRDGLWCATDFDPGLFDPELVTTIPLLARWPGWWSKVELFALDGVDALLYFDLDTFVIDDLDPILRALESALRSHHLVMLGGFTGRRDKLQSGVMAWRPCSWLRDIAQAFAETPRYHQRVHTDGDQAFIAHQAKLLGLGVVALQAIAPGCVVSYKGHELARPDAAIVCFHGKPKPPEVTGWALDHWNAYGPA